MAIQGTALLSRRQDALRDMFYRDLAVRLPRMRRILACLAATPDGSGALLQELQAQAHDIKGSGRPFGVPLASAIAAEMEDHLRSTSGRPDLWRLSAFVDDLDALTPDSCAEQG